MTAAAIDPDAFLRLIRETIPLVQHLAPEVVSLERGRAVMKLGGSPEWIRAGGTISGPAIMSLVDVALYAAVLSEIGLEPMAVTSDLSIRFLRRPPPDDLLAEATILHLGRRQAVGEVRLWNEVAPERTIAHATGTYALPPVDRPAG